MSTKPKLWTTQDVPAPAALAEFLARIQAVRDAFPNVDGFPELPPDMDSFTVEEANVLERVLLRAQELMLKREASRIASGEIAAGGF